jgi:competence protein ComEC
VFQVGYRNRYHHPKPQVEERYVARGIRRLRSDVDGAVSLEFGGALESGVGMEAYRAAHRRYWYGR